jgi:XTP/dITP diphosphohydrolase
MLNFGQRSLFINFGIFVLPGLKDMKIRKLLLGTNNPAKVGHYRRFFTGDDIELDTPQDLGIIGQPEETGITLEENAVVKAKFYFRRSGLPTLADDAGFEIPALDNFPGVLSKRFAGREMTDREVLEGILERMKGLEGGRRKARMRVVAALAFSENGVKTAEGEVEGVVPEKHYAKTAASFPYRSLLYVPKLGKWFYDLTEEEEELLGYRKAALVKLKKYL